MFESRHNAPSADGIMSDGQAMGGGSLVYVRDFSVSPAGAGSADTATIQIYRNIPS